MLTINKLTIKNCIFDNELIKELSFTLNKNDKIAIIGTEGTGKSTLLKLIKGDKLDYINYSGEIIKQGIISYIEQNISYLWDDKTVFEFLYYEVKERIDHLDVYTRIYLNDFGLEYNDIVHRKIKTFSGGEKVKLSIVKALIKEPDILLIDEPTNDLDFETIKFIENFMIKTNIPLLFISHDQRLLENVANGIIHLQHIHKQTISNTFFFKGDYIAYKERFFNKFESDLQKAKRQRSDYNQKMKKFRKIYSKVEHQQNQAVRNPSLARLLKKKIRALKSQENRYTKEKKSWIDIPEKEEPMSIFFSQTIKLNNSKRLIEFNVPQYKLPNGQIIINVDLHVSGGEKIVIYGKNGVGKTTFIKKIIDILKNKKISYGYIPQNYMDLLIPNISVIKYIMDSQEKYPEYRIRQILGQLGFKKQEMNDYISQISEGLKLKVLLLILVTKETEILILDEPTRNISPINQDEIYDLFLNYQGSIIAITHDRVFIETVFDDIYEFTKQGLILK